METIDFKEELKVYQELINIELEKQINENVCPEKELYEAMKYSLLAGGKRIRPILLLKTYELFTSNLSDAMVYAMALEMVHNFSLIHDDLPGIDNDDIRHGKPTNHIKFSEATAILAGDGLLNNSYILIANDIKESKAKDISKKIQIFEEFSMAIERMIAGEFVDTIEEGKNISKQELEYIHQNKTGALITLSVRMGAILGGANKEELKYLTCYAKKIGLAFQIQDDILGSIGNAKQMGKPVGSDEKANKNTYVSMYGLEKAKNILDKVVNDAIFELRTFDERADFLRELALYIKNREK